MQYAIELTVRYGVIIVRRIKLGFPDRLVLLNHQSHYDYGQDE